MTDPSAAAGVPPPEAGGPRRHPPRAGPLRGEEGDRLTVRRLPLGSRRARGGDRDLPRDRHHRRPQGALEEGPMSAIPAGFRAYVAEKSEDGSVARGGRAFAEGAPPPGGFAEYQRMPAGWVVPLPEALSPREAMAVGTAGFTAAMSVLRLEERGLVPGSGPGLGTGATGGGGRTAVGVLVARGYAVWAA